MKTLIIIHDNGRPGQSGVTDYTSAEVQQAGGIDALIASYAAAGVGIIKVLIYY